MLSCSEVWYDVTESDMRKLEQTDELLLRKIFDCSSQVTCEILYLELGLLPARYIIKLRRMIYFQHILKQRRKNTLLYQFLIAQIEEPKKNDWVSCIRKDMVELEIQMNSDEIEEMNIEKFKNMCKEKVVKKAYKYLENKKFSHEKVRHIQYKNLDLAEYLKANESHFSVKERQFLFKCRVNDIDAKANRSWKYPDTYCIACNDQTTIETGRHILECEVLIKKNDILSYIPAYNELFSEDIEEQIYASRMINENMKIRKEYMPE